MPRLLFVSAALVGLVGCAGPRPPAPPPPRSERASDQILAGTVQGTPAELSARADRALAEARWDEAIECLEALRGALRVDPKTPIDVASVLWRLGEAYEGASRLEDAYLTYGALRQEAPSDPRAASTDNRLMFLALYLDRPLELGRLAEQRLGHPELGERARLWGLAARALAAVASGDDVSAMRGAQDGLELSERLGVGMAGRLPVDVALLHLARAEVRRVRSERITFEHSTPSEFLPAFTARCDGLMAAQSAYTEAIRSEHPRVALLAGVRLGETYMRVHHDVLAVPPSKKADTAEKRQLHDAMMRVRYRVLLEKGGDMLERSLALAAKLHDRSPWVARARAGQEQIAQAITREHERLAEYPWSEKEIEAALEVLRKQTLAKLAAEEAKQRKSWPSP